MIAMAIISFFGYRHYKLEAEIYSMAWKISWNNVLPCNAINRQRGSVYSLAKRGSQLVRDFYFYCVVEGIDFIVQFFIEIEIDFSSLIFVDGIFRRTWLTCW